MTARVCYYNRVRRLIPLIAACMLWSGCGGKNTRVGIPASTRGPATPQAELTGLASYYAEPYHGRRTASGEIFDTYNHMTAAHRTLPFNTMVRVTNKVNGREVDVRINDRGPFIDGRVIDLSVAAARKIDMMRAGTVPVVIRILRDASRAANGSTFYAVQVGAFENEAAAQALRRRLEDRYRDVAIQTLSADRTFYRVHVGRSSDIDAAERLASRLREERFDPFVVRVD